MALTADRSARALLTQPPEKRPPLAVYVHIPFCPSKCGYCDFNSYAVRGRTAQGLEPDLVQRTVDAIIADAGRSPAAGWPAKTIFLGGGTPTFLSGEQLKAVLDAVRAAHPPTAGCEITSEANPGTVDAEKFAAMKAAGFNRLSLGAQSFLASDLHRLGRIHGPSEIENAVGAARAAGFQRLNLDLMFGLPHQSPRAWEANLDRALSLKPDHLSLYCLTIEPRTAFKRLYDQNRLPLPPEEDQLAMYNLARDRTSEAGMEQYEISNFALPGEACRHNLAYWRSEPYAAYGPGAVGCLPEADGFVRTTRLLHPRRYCEAVEAGQELAADRDLLSEDDRFVETVMLGLRLTEGLELSALSPFSRSLPEDGLREVQGRGWGVLEGGRLRLTREGQNFCSEATLLLI